MVKKSFVLVGAPASTAQEIEIDLQNTFEYLQWDVAQHFSVAEPSGGTDNILIESSSNTDSNQAYHSKQTKRVN